MKRKVNKNGGETKRGRGDIVKFMSVESKNKIIYIYIVGNVVSMLLKEVKAAGYYNVAFD